MQHCISRTFGLAPSISSASLLGSSLLVTEQHRMIVIQVSARAVTCFTVSIRSTAQSSWLYPSSIIPCPHQWTAMVQPFLPSQLLTACLRKLHGLCQPPLPCTRQAKASPQHRLRSVQPKCRNNVGYALARFQPLPQERRAHEGVLRRPFHEVRAWLHVGTETRRSESLLHRIQSKRLIGDAQVDKTGQQTF